MPVVIVCESTLLRDLLHSTCREKNHDVREVCTAIDGLKLTQGGDTILIHAMEGCDDIVPAVSTLKSSDIHVKIIVLCASRIVDCLRKELGDSVEAIIPDTLHVDSLTVTLTMVEEGYTILHSDQMGHRLAQNPVDLEDQSISGSMQPQTKSLSRQETAVLSSLQKGLPNKTIGKNLGISEATVKVHLRSIYQKMRVKNRTQAALQGNAVLGPESGGKS